jgi:hypothetical protein
LFPSLIYAANACRSSVAPPSCKERNRILAAEFDDNFRGAPGSSSITANDFEVGLVEISVDQGRYMTGFDRGRDSFFDERPRWSDLTEQPLCVGEVSPRGCSGIRAEAEPDLTIPLGIVNTQLDFGQFFELIGRVECGTSDRSRRCRGHSRA